MAAAWFGSGPQMPAAATLAAIPRGGPVRVAWQHVATHGRSATQPLMPRTLVRGPTAGPWWTPPVQQRLHRRRGSARSPCGWQRGPQMHAGTRTGVMKQERWHVQAGFSLAPLRPLPLAVAAAVAATAVAVAAVAVAPPHASRRKWCSEPTHAGLPPASLSGCGRGWWASAPRLVPHRYHADGMLDAGPGGALPLAPRRLAARMAAHPLPPGSYRRHVQAHTPIAVLRWECRGRYGGGGEVGDAGGVSSALLPRHSTHYHHSEHPRRRWGRQTCLRGSGGRDSARHPRSGAGAHEVWWSCVWACCKCCYVGDRARPRPTASNSVDWHPLRGPETQSKAQQRGNAAATGSEYRRGEILRPKRKTNFRKRGVHCAPAGGPSFWFSCANSSHCSAHYDCVDS